MGGPTNPQGIDFADVLAACRKGDEEAPDLVEAVLERHPDWVEGHKALARLRTEARHPEPLSRIEDALVTFPDHPGLWMAFISLLGASGQYARAAETLAGLVEQRGPIPPLLVMQARYEGLRGDAAKALGLLERVPADVPEREFETLRNLIRLDRYDDAKAKLDLLLERDRTDIELWALAELVWRRSGDPRHAWLLPTERLVGQTDLGLSGGELDAVVEVVRGLHDTRGEPLGQSVRSGTQTRGDLRSNEEPEIARLLDAIEAALAAYSDRISDLPADHPMAPVAVRKPRITTCWSIRLQSGGHHIPHIHEHGLVSSAVHLSLPGEDQGVLDLGRPPQHLSSDTDPVASIAPRPGAMVLFPSFLYHSTRPFRAGERLTVAFDAE